MPTRVFIISLQVLDKTHCVGTSPFLSTSQCSYASATEMVYIFRSFPDREYFLNGKVETLYTSISQPFRHSPVFVQSLCPLRTVNVQLYTCARVKSSTGGSENAVPFCLAQVRDSNVARCNVFTVGTTTVIVPIGHSLYSNVCRIVSPGRFRHVSSIHSPFQFNHETSSRRESTCEIAARLLPYLHIVRILVVAYESFRAVWEGLRKLPMTLQNRTANVLEPPCFCKQRVAINSAAEEI